MTFPISNLADELDGIVSLLTWPNDKPLPLYLRQIAVLRLRALEADARGNPGAAERYRDESWKIPWRDAV